MIYLALLLTTPSRIHWDQVLPIPVILLLVVMVTVYMILTYPNHYVLNHSIFQCQQLMQLCEELNLNLFLSVKYMILNVVECTCM